MSNTEWTQCKDALPDVGQRVMTERGEASRYSERDTTSWWCGRTGDFISTTSWCPLETASVGEDPWSNRMSIEPTDITRTMRCPTCNAVGVHTINASMRNESVLCPACAERGKHSACVVTPIEPTEEQKQAANDYLDKHVHITISNTNFERVADVVARLLAEREAKLREEVTRLEALCTEEARLIVERDTLRARVAKMQEELEGERSLSEQLFSTNGTLRARVAELEAKIADAVFSCPGCGRHDFGFFASQIKAACGPCRTRAEAAEAREAQHLARIAELEAKANEACRWCAEEDYCDCLGCGGRLPVVCVVGGKCARCGGAEREAQHLADSVCWLTGVKP